MQENNLHIVIILYFNSPMGGLHLNVMDTVEYLIKKNIPVTVIGKSGIFEEKIFSLKANYISIEFENIDYDIKYIISNLEEPSIIHTHPFKSKDIAIKLAQYYKTPLVMTLHSINDNSIKTYEENIDLFISVSELVKQYIINQNIEAKKIVTIPNGIDINKLQQLGNKQSFGFDKNYKNILTVTRYDKDKKFIVDSIFYSLEIFLEKGFFDFNWTFVGDGSEIQKLKDIALKINTKANREVINFLGWREKEFIVPLYKECDIFIAPGRNVIEAMSFSKPIVAIGSKGYIGIVDESNYLDAIYTNFGGNNNRQKELLYGDLNKILSYSQKELESLGKISYFICKTFFDLEEANKKLLNIYNLLSNIKSNAYKQKFLLEKLNNLLSDFKNYYIKGETKNIIKNINIYLDSVFKNMNIYIFIIEFDEKKKIFAKSYPLKSDKNHIFHKFNEKTKYIKIAFRIETLDISNNYFYLNKIKLQKLEKKEYIPNIEHIENNIKLKKGKYTYSFDTKYNKYIYFANYKPSKKVIISFNGAVDRTKMTYNFQRYSWSDDIDYSWIQFIDPTIKEENDLNLGWYQGNKNEFAIEVMANYIKKLLKENNIKEEDVIFFGSSAGGFASLKIANFFNNSKIIVINPQLYLEKYPKRYFNSMVEYVYQESYPRDRINVKVDFEKRKKSIFYFQNIEDKLHYEPHLKEWLSSLDSNLYKEIEALEDVDCSKKLNVLIYSDEKTGHNPPNKEVTLELLNYLIKEIEC